MFLEHDDFAKRVDEILGVRRETPKVNPRDVLFRRAQPYVLTVLSAVIGKTIEVPDDPGRIRFHQG